MQFRGCGGEGPQRGAPPALSPGRPSVSPSMAGLPAQRPVGTCPWPDARWEFHTYVGNRALDAPGPFQPQSLLFRLPRLGNRCHMHWAAQGGRGRAEGVERTSSSTPAPRPVPEPCCSRGLVPLPGLQELVRVSRLFLLTPNRPSPASSQSDCAVTDLGSGLCEVSARLRPRLVHSPCRSLCTHILYLGAFAHAACSARVLFP